MMAYLSGPHFDVEVVAFVGDFEDLRPGEAVDPELVPVHEQPAGTHAQHYLEVLLVLQT